MDFLTNHLATTVDHIRVLALILSVLLQIIFAAGIAKDVGNLHKTNTPPQFVPGYAWILATLIGGLLVVVAYWLMHHSSLARSFKS